MDAIVESSKDAVGRASRRNHAESVSRRQKTWTEPSAAGDNRAAMELVLVFQAEPAFVLETTR
jgi:hypothetical protein